MNFFQNKLGIKLKLIVFYEVKLCLLYVVSRFYNINFLFVSFSYLCFVWSCQNNKKFKDMPLVFRGLHLPNSVPVSCFWHHYDFHQLRKQYREF